MEHKTLDELAAQIGNNNRRTVGRILAHLAQPENAALNARIKNGKGLNAWDFSAEILSLFPADILDGDDTGEPMRTWCYAMMDVHLLLSKKDGQS